MASANLQMQVTHVVASHPVGNYLNVLYITQISFNGRGDEQEQWYAACVLCWICA